MPITVRWHWPGFTLLAVSTSASVTVGSILWLPRPAARHPPAEVAAAPAPPAGPSRPPLPPPAADPPRDDPPLRPEPAPVPRPAAPEPVPAPLPGFLAPPGRLVPEPKAVPARFKVGDELVQEVAVSRRSAYRFAGLLEVSQSADYTFTSRLTVEQVGRDGSLGVRQVIEGAKLVGCDPSMREALGDALKKAAGAKFEIAVGPDGVVTGLTGPKDPVRVLAGNDPANGQTVRVWSLLDADGWKELAGLTFLRPAKPPRVGDRWARPIAHNWGPLGEWAGRTTFVATAKAGGADRIEYAHELAYRPSAAGAGRELPFQLRRADFRVLAAGGAVLYDAAKDRVSAADETFRVRGALLVSLGGTDATVEMEEAQVFRLRVAQPTTAVLSGRARP